MPLRPWQPPLTITFSLAGPDVSARKPEVATAPAVMAGRLRLETCIEPNCSTSAETEPFFGVALGATHSRPKARRDLRIGALYSSRQLSPYLYMVRPIT